MLVCRKNAKTAGEARPAEKVGEGGTDFAARQGGPVFVPRRKPSALAETLLAAGGGERVTAYDEKWFAGRPAT